MPVIEFLVQGSAEETYRVTFNQRSPGNFSAYCTCMAGQNGQYCKHRFAIMGGDVLGVVSDNAHEAQTIIGWIAGTDVEQAIAEYRAAELECEAAKRKLVQAKKRLAAALLD